MCIILGADTMRDFQDTAERQRQRWLTRFTDDLTADLKRILPILAMAAIEVEEAGEKLVSGDEFCPRENLIRCARIFTEKDIVCA